MKNINFEIYKYKGYEVNIFNADIVIQFLCPDYHKYFPYYNHDITWEERSHIVEKWVTDNQVYYHNIENGEINITNVVELAILENKNNVLLDRGYYDSLQGFDERINREYYE